MAGQQPIRAAVVIVHGIGEQPPVSTLGRFAQGLMDHAGASQPEAALKLVAGDSTPLLRFRNVAAGVDADVLEFAWQHLVRGRMTALATLRWLLATTLAPFDFGRHWRILASAGAEAPPSWQIITRQLLVAFGLLLPLLGVIAAAVLLLHGWLSGSLIPRIPAGVNVSFPEGALFVISLLLVLAGLVQLLAIIRDAWTAAALRRRSRRLHGMDWSGLHGSALAAWRGPALLVGLLLLAAAVGAALLAADVYRFLGAWFTDPQSRHWLLSAVLAVASLVLSPLFLRWVRNYAGDIAYYVTADRTPAASRSRYDIRRNAARMLQALLHDPDYDRIIVVGHSLGSVIAFDALNELSRQVRLENVHSADQVGKLTGLLTFASPLDKVAYFFREQTSDDAALHAQLLSYLHPTKRQSSRRDDGPYAMAGYGVPFHRLRWINLHAPLDAVSDPLVFYGVDESCAVHYWPAGAHGRYWRDARTYRLLQKLLVL